MYAEIKDNESGQTTVTINNENINGGTDNGAGNYGTTQTECTGLGRTPEEYSFSRRLVKNLCYVGFVSVAAGLVIELSGLSAGGATVGYLEIGCVFVPIVLLVLNFRNKVCLTINHIMAITLCTLVSTVVSFFRVIAYGKMSASTGQPGPYGSAAAGSFYVFLGEALMLAATVLVVKGQ